MSLPLVMTAQGAQPQSPAAIRATLLASVAAIDPGYTATLPGSMIEDISSTDVAAIALIDSAQVDTINSLTPYGANPFILNQLGQVYGVPLGKGTNTAVYMTFSGPPGFVISIGFTVADSLHQYTVQNGVIIPSSGTTDPVFCLATQAGTWAVPSGTVVNLVTSVPSGIALTCTNPIAGIPSTGDQTEEDYRAQVVQAGLASAQGMPDFVKTQIQKVPGVQTRLVSIQRSGSGWLIMVGGTGDAYQIGDAIYRGLFDISNLMLSTLSAVAITNANPGVVTTNIKHAFGMGQVIAITGATPGTFNGSYTITPLTPHTFSLGVDTTAFGTYVGGGVITPNFRNQIVTINSFPDLYPIAFVIPFFQGVTMTITWNTTALNLISDVAVAGAVKPAIAAYVNSIYAGQPMNLFELQNTFQLATAAILPTELLTRMVFAVAIDGEPVNPDPGTGILEGDPLCYFTANQNDIIVIRG